MIIKHKLKMEMTGKEPTPYIEVIQHEKKSRILELSLEENGLPISLPGTCKPVIRYKKPGRRYSAYDTLETGDDAWYIRGNTVGILLLPEICDTDGNVELRLELVDENEILYTFPVEVRVRENGFTKARVSNGGHFAGFLPQPEDAKEGEYLYAAEIDPKGRVIRTESKTLKNAYIGPTEPQDENVNLWVDTDEVAPEVPAGKDGKTAYEYAQEGGYTGTEAEFAAKLAADNTGNSISVTAEVGQTIVVKAVDENGKPTEWESADYQPRTHYDILGKIIEETNVPTSGEFTPTTNAPIVKGETYTVQLGDREFILEAGSTDTFGVPVVYIGDIDALLGEEDFSIPFCLLHGDAVGGTVLVTFDNDKYNSGVEEIQFSMDGPVTIPIPEKYIVNALPYYIPVYFTKDSQGNVDSVACADTVANVEAALKSGRPIAVKYTRPLREFCVSDFRQNQEYHVFNVQDEGLFPLSKFLPVGWDGMRAVCGVNAGPACRESYFRGISLPCGQRT